MNYRSDLTDKQWELIKYSFQYHKNQGSGNLTYFMEDDSRLNGQQVRHQLSFQLYRPFYTCWMFEPATDSHLSKDLVHVCLLQ